MKKLINKLEKWALRNKNKIKIIWNEITECLIGIGLITATLSLINGTFWVIIVVCTLLFFLNISFKGMDEIIKEWKQAKEKDRKDNEK